MKGSTIQSKAENFAKYGIIRENIKNDISIFLFAFGYSFSIFGFLFFLLVLLCYALIFFRFETDKIVKNCFRFQENLVQA
jgi:hypothetical protein